MRKRCETCGQVKADVKRMPDPYEADVNDRIVMVSLCTDCMRAREDDI